MIVQPTFFIPPEIEAGLLTGDLHRYGGVVRNKAGRLVTYLEEISAPKPNEDAVGAAAGMFKKPVVIAGLATLAVAATATAAVAILRERKWALPECVKNYTDSLRAYLKAVRDQNLDAKIIDRLIADLDATKAHSENGNITVDFSTGQSESLVQVVIDYTRQLAQANSIDLDESPESTPTSADAPVMNLRRCPWEPAEGLQRRSLIDSAPGRPIHRSQALLEHYPTSLITSTKLTPLAIALQLEKASVTWTIHRRHLVSATASAEWGRCSRGGRRRSWPVP